jgi:hypothetical protein
MSAIDRRMLFGAMGAGLLLAGCKHGEKKDDVLKEDKDCGDSGHGAGESKLWGDPVSQKRPRGVSSMTPFKPDYLCAAYIRFEADGIVVRQGYVHLTGSAVDSEAEQNALAVKLLHELKAPSTPPQVTVEFPYSDFDNFSMNGEQVLVLFVDNLPSLVRFVADSDMQPATPQKPKENFLDHIVRFTRFSGRLYGQEMEKNYAFCALKPIDLTGQGFEGTLAYRMNYWNRTLAGDINSMSNKPDKNHPETWRRFSMNIHLRMAAKPTGSGSTVTFPVVLDPDTGNMGSNP